MFHDLKWEHVGSLVIAASVTASFGYFVISASNKTDNTTAALVTVNARLDRLFDKLDQINATLPVLVERENEDRMQITDGRGQWSSLMGRMVAIENNVAAVHAEAVEPKRPGR